MINLSAWQEYVERRCGFVLPPSQQSWLEYTIESVAKSLETDVNYLYIQVCRDKEIEQLLFDRLLISETRFFRHQESVDFVLKKYDEHRLNQKRTPILRDFRVWSAGCSAGQEVYSVAMGMQMISDSVSEPASYIVSGSDLSQKSLKSAQTAQYLDKDIKGVPMRYRHYLQQVKVDNPEQEFVLGQPKVWQVSQKITKQCHFFWQNLFLKPPLDLPLQNIILCQNVLIYFRKFDQRDILNYFVQHLDVGGYLVLAPSEVMFWQHPKMKRVDNIFVNAWQKIEH
ncbi:CheR family methyltransferase [Moraxella oblonga]|uniref:CheR family methyltransferase n=1 Tax=Moraxella oblonga TaxID=200413 RepID=UPI00082A71A6|nr:CheR family methyltransferase [Moraxella oblonga]